MTKKILIVSVLAISIVSCTFPLGNSQPKWEYEKSAIDLCIQSDPRLNHFQAKAHSLMVCIYHLRDLNGLLAFFTFSELQAPAAKIGEN
jgi:predicted component of type VI protein secretion system